MQTERRMNIYMERDADPGILAGKTIAVAGYGNQGRPQALNLRDSGCTVIVGAREGGRGRNLAREDGFAVATIAEAARRADILLMLLPDELQEEIYNKEVRGALRAGAALCFAHGFAVAFGGIRGEGYDLLLVAPKGQGSRVREAYLEGSGLPCFIGVERDVSGVARKLALAVAGALGCLRAGGYETSFREEAVSDIFGEQAVLCGGVSALMKRAFDVLVKRGHSPEVAYFECFHEVKIIVDLFSRLGLSGMRDVISGTAAYGSLTFGEGLIGDDVERKMEELYELIESGAFAKIWLEENRTGCKEFRKLREKERGLLIETIGTEVRARSDASRESRGGAKKGS
jgi:ketol-acid reductoisomerase